MFLFRFLKYIIFPAEAEAFIEALELLDYASYGKEQWYRQHTYMDKLNMQVILLIHINSLFSIGSCVSQNIVGRICERIHNFTSEGWNFDSRSHFNRNLATESFQTNREKPPGENSNLSGLCYSLPRAYRRQLT